jgi:hypothetical protein
LNAPFLLAYSKERAFYQIVMKYVNPGTQEAVMGLNGFDPME